MKKLVIYAALIIMAIIALYYFNWLPIVVIDPTKEVLPAQNGFQQQPFNPIENSEFNEESCAYLVLSADDMQELPEQVVHSKVLYCNDVKLLEKLKRNFVFSPSGGDMATCESSIVIYTNNKKVFQSGIVVRAGLIGLQNELTGWADAASPTELIGLFSCFKASRAFVLNLN
jgi:hypothetical protein